VKGGMLHRAPPMGNVFVAESEKKGVVSRRWADACSGEDSGVKDGGGRERSVYGGWGVAKVVLFFCMSAGTHFG